MKSTKSTVEELAQFVREVREVRGWSQHQLAAVLQLSQSYVGQVEAISSNRTKFALDFCRELYQKVLTKEEKARLLDLIYRDVTEYVQN